MNRLVLAVGEEHCRYMGRNMWAECSNSNAAVEKIRANCGWRNQCGLCIGQTCHLLRGQTEMCERRD